MKKKVTAIVTIIAILAVFFGTVVGSRIKTVQAATTFRVHYIDVGAGDGALLQYGSGSKAKYALIDAGPVNYTRSDKKVVNTSRIVYNYLKRYKIRKLEFIIMTHPHIDHIGGFQAILEDASISVGTVYKTQTPVYNHYQGEDDLFSTKTAKKLDQLIEKRGIRVVNPAVGSKVYLGSAKLTFYSPGRSNYKFGRQLSEESFKKRQINKFSIVCRITYGKNSYLMTGDTQQESVVDMVKQNLYLKSQVLKVPHHGYEDVREQDINWKNYKTNHKYLFDRVNPAISIVSNGYKNKDKTPSASILRELSKSSIYTTSSNGTIIVSSNGKKLWVKTTKNANEPAKSSSYVSSKKSSNLLKKMYVKSSGKKKITVVGINKKNTYKTKESKALKLKIMGTPQSFNTLSKVQYKLVKAGKSNSKYRWKSGRTVKVKKGFKGRLYIKYKTTTGNVIVKTKGFSVKKKK